ncbi:hypothetical protein LEN26_008329 [Aphanomyces euteiches]|nr:hypothetical protein LEN26_008329 [Aphanomyces euteiches]KAH9191591.1 hypothetical protein AeNC1_006429 [Aphanomyces euteiches]
MESDPRMDLQLIREGELERERLQKESFNMKLRINFLEEQLLKYKEGTAFEDEDFESENIHLRTVVEEKVQELERRNFLLVRARDAIEVLRADLESAKEANRFMASRSQNQLDEASQEIQRLELEVMRLEEEVNRLRSELEELNAKCEELLKQKQVLELELQDQIQRSHQAGEDSQQPENFAFEVERVRRDTHREAQKEFDARLGQERAAWSEERMKLLADLDQKDVSMKALSSGKASMDYQVERLKSQIDTLMSENNKLQDKLTQVARESDEDVFGLRLRCQKLESEVKQSQDRCRESDAKMHNALIAQEELQNELDSVKLIQAGRESEDVLGLRLRCQKLESEVKHSQDRCRESEAKMHNAMIAHENLQNQLESMKRQRGGVDDDVKQLQKKLEDAASFNKTLIAELNSAREEIKSMKPHVITDGGDILKNVQTELSEARARETELNLALEVAFKEKSRAVASLQEAEQKLAKMNDANATSRKEQEAQSKSWQQDRQYLEAKIDNLERELLQCRAKLNNQATETAFTSTFIEELKRSFDSKIREYNGRLNEKADFFRSSLDKLESRLFDAKLQLSSRQKANHDFEQKCEQVSRAKQDLSNQHNALAKKYRQLDAEYQRILGELINSKEAQSIMEGENANREAKIRLLHDEVAQSRQLKDTLERQLKAMMQEQGPLKVKILQLQEKVKGLEDGNRGNNQVQQSEDPTAELGTKNHYAKALNADKLESIIAKAAQLQDHTRRFQQKHAAIWQDAMSGKSVPASVDSDCKRLLKANTLLCQKIAQVAMEVKQGQNSVTQIIHGDEPPTRLSQNGRRSASKSVFSTYELEKLTQSIQATNSRKMPSLNGRRQEFKSEFSSHELEALGQRVRPSNVLPQYNGQPATVRVVEAFQATQQMLEGLHGELMKARLDDFSTTPNR